METLEQQQQVLHKTMIFLRTN